MARSTVKRWAATGGGTSLVLAVALLTGCTGTPANAPQTSGSVTASHAATSAPTATPRPVAKLVPGGTAQQNLGLFRSVTEKVWGSADKVSGRAYVDALVRAGFTKSAMQVTEDQTTVGNPAESIQFSVLWAGGQCLVGQVGPSTGNPVTTVLDALPGKKCLIGKTRPITW